VTKPFAPDDYGPSVAAILGDGQRLIPLGPGNPVQSMREAIQAFNPESDWGPVRNREAAFACWAGLWLYWDFLDEAHLISQDLHTPEGSAWHAIVHSREPDAWNSNSWWDRVGKASWMVNAGYDSPKLFVEECERLRDRGTAEEINAMRIQLKEWQALFDHCHRLAVPG
jgi:hypothetical protein